MTHDHDQPPEHWAGPESLDPTPVSRQYLVIALLLLVGVGSIGVVAVLSFATQLATPPAVVPGNRVVLSRDALPLTGAGLARIGAPLLDDQDAFWISQPDSDEYVAVSAWWATASGAECAIIATEPRRGPAGPPPLRTSGGCVEQAEFTTRGEPAGASRGLERYLVAVEGDRVVVNVGRAIRGVGQTPQPTRSPLQ